MTRPPRVSIVMPVRDAADTLPAALESIRRQTLSAWELVVVDDGSRDETSRILNRAADADTRIRVLRRFVEAPVAHPSVMFRRDLLERFGTYAAGDFPEDYELWLRWLDAGVRFGKVEAELLTWNDPPTRLSRIAPRYHTHAFYRIKCQFLSHWLKRHLHPPRELWLWGAGRITRQRFRTLESLGLHIAGFIDIDPGKLGRMIDGRLVVGPHQLPPPNHAFILSGVSTRGAREQIAETLIRAGRTEGKDFLLAA